MFKTYQSKPITREAFQITTEMQYDIEKDCQEESLWIYSPSGEDRIVFKAYEVPVVNDWIVRLTQEDTYHARDEVFRERNIVE